MTLALTLLLLIFAIALSKTKNNYLLILISALFSSIAAGLYYLHAAPDIALAEIAIGCAFIPLIFTIAIMRQNTFTVVFFNQTKTQAYCDPEILLEFMAIAEYFCEVNRLKLKIITHPLSYEPTVKGVFRMGNTDLIANYFEETKKLTIWGNGRNKLIPSLAEALKSSTHIIYEDAEMNFFME